MQVRRVFAALLLGLLLLPGAVLAAPPLQDAAVTLEARPAYGGSYRVGSWIPIVITLQNNGPDYTGDVRIAEPRSRIAYGTRVDLPRGARKVVTVYARVENAARRMVASFVVADETLAQADVRLDPHLNSEQLVGVLATNGARPALPDRDSGLQLRFASVELSVGDLPELEQGLQSFAAIVVDDADTSSLTDGQRVALLHWVARGGRLVVMGSAGTKTTLAGLPPQLQLVEPGEQQTIDGRELARFVGGAAEPPAQLTVLVAQPLEGARVVAADEEIPLIVERPIGQGSVLFMAVALSSPGLTNWSDAPRLWAQLLVSAQNGVVITGMWGPGPITLDEQRVQSLANNLSNLPALDLPALWLPASLLLAYILLVGPLAYLVLRRLDRQAAGWVVIPVLTLLFSVLAYGIAYNLRGGDVVVNQVSVVEPLFGDAAQVQSYVGVFSPGARSYDVSFDEQPLVRPVPLFMGPPEATRDDGLFLQGNAAAQGLSISQWSMRAVMGEQTVQLGAVGAVVRYDAGKLEATVTNNLAAPLRDLVVVQGVSVARFGDLAPGMTSTVTLAPEKVDVGMSLGYLVYRNRLEINNPSGGPVPVDRDAQRRQGVIDALYANGPTPRGAAPVLLAWLDAAPLAAQVSAERVDQQQLTLLTDRPRLEFASGPLDLARGWSELRANDQTGNPIICYTPRGLGFGTYNGNVEATLSLPAELRDAALDEVALEVESDGAWPKQATFELYDRDADAWQVVELGGPGRWVLDNWQRYLGPNGELQLRFNNGGVTPSSSCIGVSLTVKGQMP